ncbi:conserved hypothetical protein [Trichinella spiralis]|uniref:hypothetical protein n=1 Tax=Trichinella spiralis TaxID=6334 RepID=UPI0001EFBBFF|nr:conserved hypothetical protein [Trichinella spiralis]
MNYQLNAHHFFNHLLIILLCLQMPYCEQTVETNITTTNDMLTTLNNETETTTIEPDTTITTVELETDNVEMKKSNDRHTPTIRLTGNRESYYDRHLNNESATGVVIRNAHNRTAMSCGA